jgi:hypothetical protein
MINNGHAARVWWGLDTCLILLLAMLAAGCATSTFVQPEEFDVGVLRERAETLVEQSVRVSAAIPSREQSHAIFGIDLSSRNIQPVWLEIENNSDLRLHFMRTGLDPEYFSPREVGFAFHGSLSDESKEQLDWHLEGLNFENPIAPGSTVSGFVYTNEDKETKFVRVDLLGRGWSGHLTLVVPVPDRLLSDGHIARLHAMLSESKPLHVKKASELRTQLEKLPCCTASEDGVEGLPLNVVLIGDLGALAPALARRHFHYTPTNPLYVFGRPQDISLRKGERWVAAQPHMLRAWLTNIRFQGMLVWVGQLRTPLGGRFAGDDDESLPLSDPDVDEARNDLVQDAIF